MQCTTGCFTGVSLGTGAVRAENSWSSAENGFSTTGQGKLGLNCRLLERSVTKNRRLDWWHGNLPWVFSRPVAGRNTLVGLAPKLPMIPTEGGLVPSRCRGRTGCSGTGL